MIPFISWLKYPTDFTARNAVGGVVMRFSSVLLHALLPLSCASQTKGLIAVDDNPYEYSCREPNDDEYEKKVGM